jgi:hypothetical protein
MLTFDGPGVFVLETAADAVACVGAILSGTVAVATLSNGAHVKA